MKYLMWGMVVLLIIGHQDIWFWDDTTLLGGFMPVGLFYHACISVAAAGTWYLATIYAWPDHLEETTLSATHGQKPEGKTS